LSLIAIAIQRATELHERYDLQFPVDIPCIVEDMEINLIQTAMSSSVDGMYWRSTFWEPNILINSSICKPAGRRLFTMGHELCHHILMDEVEFADEYGHRTRFFDSTVTPDCPLSAHATHFPRTCLCPNI
jgi:Zn-dependent peptidase ImmA (M78 family)